MYMVGFQQHAMHVRESCVTCERLLCRQQVSHACKLSSLSQLQQVPSNVRKKCTYGFHLSPQCKVTTLISFSALVEQKLLCRPLHVTTPSSDLLLKPIHCTEAGCLNKRHMKSPRDYV